MGLLENIFGDMNSREIKKIEKIVNRKIMYNIAPRAFWRAVLIIVGGAYGIASSITD